MPELLFKAFMSCSLADEDSQTVDFFRGLIRSFDIEPLVYDYQEIGRIPDKIKEHIINSDCLIAVATRRQKLDGTDLWTCPDWIQHEVALAHPPQRTPHHSPAPEPDRGILPSARNTDTSSSAHSSASDSFHDPPSGSGGCATVPAHDR